MEEKSQEELQEVTAAASCTKYRATVPTNSLEDLLQMVLAGTWNAGSSLTSASYSQQSICRFHTFTETPRQVGRNSSVSPMSLEQRQMYLLFPILNVKKPCVSLQSCVCGNVS